MTQERFQKLAVMLYEAMEDKADVVIQAVPIKSVKRSTMTKLYLKIGDKRFPINKEFATEAKKWRVQVEILPTHYKLLGAIFTI